MTRTKFNRDENTVTLVAEDPFTGLRIQRTFNVPNRPEGGYVREGERQVCSGLSSMGPTLSATRDGLADCIRREWKAYRENAKRQGF